MAEARAWIGARNTDAAVSGGSLNMQESSLGAQD
jgi:hypothetical protein